MSGMDAILQGGLQGYLVVALLLFAIGLAAVLLRRTLLMQFMGVELMLNAANVALLASTSSSSPWPPARRASAWRWSSVSTVTGTPPTRTGPPA